MKKDIIYEKLSDNALKCMYVATAITSIIGLIVIGVLNYAWFFPSDIQVCKILSFIISIIILLNAVISPYFRHSRYRYCINDECIDVKEGYLFINRDIVPIERLHKLQINKGPIDRMFHVAKLNVTTAGGDVTIRFLDEKKIEDIAESLKKRINNIVIEQNEE